MTTRQELLGHVRKAIREVHQCEDSGKGELYDEMAFAAIKAVYKAIGDHQLAVMIGDTGKRERVVISDGQADEDGLELLQEGGEDD